MIFKEDRFKQDETDYWLLSSIFSEKPVYIKINAGTRKRTVTFLSTNEDNMQGHKKTYNSPITYLIKDIIVDIDSTGIEVEDASFDIIPFNNIDSSFGIDKEIYNRVPFEAVKAFYYLKKKTKVVIYIAGNEDGSSKYFGGFVSGKITSLDKGGISLRSNNVDMTIPFDSIISIDVQEV